MPGNDPEVCHNDDPRCCRPVIARRCDNDDLKGKRDCITRCHEFAGTVQDTIVFNLSKHHRKAVKLYSMGASGLHASPDAPAISFFQPKCRVIKSEKRSKSELSRCESAKRLYLFI